MAYYLMPEQAVVHPGLSRPSLLKPKLCPIEIFCLTHVPDREGEMKWLEGWALTPYTCGERPLHEEEVSGHLSWALEYRSGVQMRMAGV